MSAEAYKPQRSHLDFLRNALLSCAPAGEQGFEGLVAAALGDRTGLTFRLANSGSQFGRDARSDRGAFSIAIEAKRYDGKLRLEDLSGKARLAGHSLQGEVDLWVLGTTRAIGENVVLSLEKILDEYGVSLLVLDWTQRPIPPLAVLCAGAAEATLEWFERNRPDTDLIALQKALEAVASHRSFAAQDQRLGSQLNAAEIGLDSLREQNNEWLRSRLRDRRLSQQTFGQYLAVMDPAAETVTRQTFLNALSEKLVPDKSEPTTVAIVGEEGVGKSWLVAQWLAMQAELPIVLLVSGRQTDILNPGKPLNTLAQLISDQVESNVRSAGPERWLLRLRRWKRQERRDRLRFMVVLDGLNERPNEPWSDIIRNLSAELYQLGGILVLTARSGYWDREVVLRLGNLPGLRTLPLTGYTDQDLSLLLGRVQSTPARLPSSVREFIRNPRVCSIAIDLLSRLCVQPDELTVERLLLEYWRRRLEERGDLIAHNLNDFHNLLRSHAEAWLKQPRRTFDRDDWAMHSGLAKRAGLGAVRNDLTEIEEGRFLTIATGDGHQSYEFRSETLPFAVALFITNELKASLRADEGSLTEHVGSLLAPVQGFDLMAEIVGAALTLACLDENCPALVRKCLVLTFYDLQNISSEASAKALLCLRSCPDAFLAALETPESESRDEYRQEQILGALLAQADLPEVWAAIRNRIARWLGCWSLRPKRLSPKDVYEKWLLEYQVRVRAALGQLSSTEAEIFARLCMRIDDAPVLWLHRAAALFLIGRRQSEFAGALAAWAIASGIARDPYDVTSDLSWIVRLNRSDFEATEASVKQHLSEVKPECEPMRVGVAIALRLLGTEEAAAAAEHLDPSMRRQVWRRVEHFCDTDPHDPRAAIGSNLDNSRAVISSTVPDKIWNHMSNAIEDADISAAMPAMARFDNEPLLRCLRQIARSIERRIGLPLRQLAWRLPMLSPLLDNETVRVIEGVIPSLKARTGSLSENDVVFVVGEAVAAILPHVDGEKQIQLFLEMPEGIPTYLFLRRALRPVSPEALERLLVQASEAKDNSVLKWILFHASGSAPSFSERSGNIVLSLVYGSDLALAGCASDALFVASDSTLNRRLLEEAVKHQLNHRKEDTPWRDRAIAAAVASERRGDLMYLVAPSWLGAVADSLGGTAMGTYCDVVERVIRRLLRPIVTPAPDRLTLTVRTDEKGITWRETEETEPAEDDEVFSGTINDSTSLKDADTFARRQAERRVAVQQWEEGLAGEDASEFALPWNNFESVIQHDARRAGRWLDWILAVDEPRILAQAYNLGVSLAGAFSAVDSTKAATVLAHLRGKRSFLMVVVGQESIPLYHHALFAAPREGSLDPLREELFFHALDDGAIETAVLAAELRNTGSWLDRFVDRLRESRHPADQALALTVAGLRFENEHSGSLFERTPGPGFLGEVFERAKDVYVRAGWTKHWLGLALGAESPIDLWRFGQLAENLADWRFAREFAILSSAQKPEFRLFSGELHMRLSKAAEARRSKRRSKLFGLEPPNHEVLRELAKSRIQF